MSTMPIKDEQLHYNKANLANGDSPVSEHADVNPDSSHGSLSTSCDADDYDADENADPSSMLMNVAANPGGSVDDLMVALTRKLCLKSKSCHPQSTHYCKRKRMSPYNVHNLSNRSANYNCCCLNCKYFTNKNGNKSSSDTYDLMQSLLREGCLIKEAVKRLQLGTGSKIATTPAINNLQQQQDSNEFIDSPADQVNHNTSFVGE